jgi:hypothetical protein
MLRGTKRPIVIGVLLAMSAMAASVAPTLAGSAGGGNVDISGTEAVRSLLPGQCVILGIDGSNDILLVKGEAHGGVVTTGVRIPVPGTKEPPTNEQTRPFRNCNNEYETKVNLGTTPP